MTDRIVIAGGGVAAQRCAFALRRLGHEGPIELVSAEDEVPYDRTMLSKDLLASEERLPCVPLADAAAYADAGIDLRLGVRAVGLDPAEPRIALSDGDALDYTG